MKTIEDIALELRDDEATIQLIFGFNSVGRHNFQSRLRI